MAAKTYVIHLSEEERTVLTKTAGNKLTKPRQKQRAQILLLSDTSLPRDKGASRSDAEIVEQLECHPLTIRKTRKRAIQRGVLASLKRKATQRKAIQSKPVAHEVQVSESAQEIDWEEQERQLSAYIKKLPDDLNMKDELQKVDQSLALRLGAASTIFEKATGYGLLENTQSVDALNLIPTETERLSDMDALSQAGVLCRNVQPLIHSLLAALKRTEKEDGVNTVGKSTADSPIERFRQELEKMGRQADDARRKMWEQSSGQSYGQNWIDPFKEYFAVVVEIYEDIDEAINLIPVEYRMYWQGIVRASKPMKAELLSAQSARDRAQEKAENRAAEIERMRRSGFVTPPYNVRCFADAFTLSPSTIKILIAAYIEFHKNSDFPSQFRNNPTRKTDKGGYITDNREDAERFCEFLWDHTQGKGQTTKPKTAQKSG